MERSEFLLPPGAINWHFSPPKIAGSCWGKQDIVLGNLEGHVPGGAQVTQSQSLGTRPGNLPFKHASPKVEKLGILLFVNDRKLI